MQCTCFIRAEAVLQIQVPGFGVYAPQEVRWMHGAKSSGCCTNWGRLQFGALHGPLPFGVAIVAGFIWIPSGTIVQLLEYWSKGLLPTCSTRTGVHRHLIIDKEASSRHFSIRIGIANQLPKAWKSCVSKSQESDFTHPSGCEEAQVQPLRRGRHRGHRQSGRGEGSACGLHRHNGHQHQHHHDHGCPHHHHHRPWLKLLLQPSL